MCAAALEDLLSMPSDFWACLQIRYPREKQVAGIVFLERKDDALYLYRVSTRCTDIQSLYYSILEDMRLLVNRHAPGIRSMLVQPLYGYGMTLYTDSIKHLQKEIVVAPPRVLLTYNVCSVDNKPSKRTIDFLKYV